MDCGSYMGSEELVTLLVPLMSTAKGSFAMDIDTCHEQRAQASAICCWGFGQDNEVVPWSMPAQLVSPLATGSRR